MTHLQKMLGLRGLTRRLSAMSTAQPASASKFYDVPEGHSNSDLSQIACNIGLNRRRELTLGAAGQTTVYVGGVPQRLADLLKDKKTVLFGVPDCGKKCSEEHVPGYLKSWDTLRRQGITQVLCVSVDEPAVADAWGKSVGVDGSTVQIVADPSQALTRLLGMELGGPGAPGPRSLRYAVLLDNGVVLKVVSFQTRFWKMYS
jgi:peroxiredoxin